MRARRWLPAVLWTCACGPGAPQEGETDGSSSSSSSSTSGGGPSTSDPPMTTAEPPPTTSGPEDETCPEGQPSLTPLWSATIEQDTELEKLFVGPPLVLSDGRIAVAAAARGLDAPTFAAGLAWFSPEGVPLGWQSGEMQPLQTLEVTAAQVTADDTVVVTGPAHDGEAPVPFITRFDASGSELARSVLKTKRMLWPAALELHADDTAVLLGMDPLQSGMWLARVDIDTGAALWELEVPDSLTSALAVGPSGEIVAAMGTWSSEPPSVMKVVRADAAGALVWTRDLFEPGGSGALSDLVVTADGQVLVLRRWFTPEEKITATSLGLADGATLWDEDAVMVTPAGPPELLRARVEADQLLLPIARRPFSDGPLTVELHRMSTAGQLGDFTTLSLAGREVGRPRVKIARGRCGELVLLQEEFVPWLGMFAP